jgi:prepilin-type N-terminal cleavage/methylation domain-containing protein
VPRNAGFTLIEVMVALAISGLVVLSTERLFAGAGDGARVLTEARGQLDRDANARRWLEATFLSLAVGDSGATGFTGDRDRVRFTALQLTPGGWFEPRQIDLGLRDGRLGVGVSPGESLILADSVIDLAFDYLLEPGADTRWVQQWVSPVSAPLAVRVRLGRARGVVDTLLFLIKERG